MISTYQTHAKCKFIKFPVHEGSTKSDVMGPVHLDHADQLPVIDPNQLKDYYGKRFVLAGGKLSDSDSDIDNDDTDEDVVAEPPEAQPQAAVATQDDKNKRQTTLLAPHCLPVSVVTDIFTSYGVKHVIDMCPTPLPLAYKSVSMGGSYVALCSSTLMAHTLKKNLFNALILGVVNPAENYCTTHASPKKRLTQVLLVS